MKRIIGTVLIMAMLVALTYEMVMCVLDPNWMWGSKRVVLEVGIETEEVTEEDAEMSETAQIECETVHFECVMGASIEESTEETTEEATTTIAEEEETVPEQMLVDGCALDPELYEFLRVTLSSMGLTRYLPYALCQIYQESSFNVYAEAENGQDKGLLQFRLKYWDWEDGDIFDPYAQLRVYCRRMHDKDLEGLNIYQIISDHYTGGVGYSAQYVQDVVRWMDTMDFERE